MSRILLQPAIFATGISLFLFGHNQALTPASYLSPLPFWVIIGRPLGLFWNTKVLSELNKEIFPASMKNYRELYLVSNRAIAYDLMFNHCLFNPLQALIISAYTYSIRRLESKVSGEQTEAPSLIDVLSRSGVGLLKMRAMVSLVSIMS